MIINSVLDGMTLQVRCLFSHSFTILLSNLGRLNLKPAPALKVDKFGRPVGKRKINLLSVVECVEQQHFVLAMAQVPQCIHQRVVVGRFYQCVGKNHNHRPPVQPLGG